MSWLCLSLDARRLALHQFSGRASERAARGSAARQQWRSTAAGLGIADLPEFIVGDAIASGKVEAILKDWKQTEGSVHLVTPPGGPRPARVEVLADFLTKHFAKGKKRKQ
jgi:DNA-binding transcriptional LysR family regulator